MPTFKEAMCLACIAAAYGFVSQFDFDRRGAPERACACACPPSAGADGDRPGPSVTVDRPTPSEDPLTGAASVSPQGGTPACACSPAGSAPPDRCSPAESLDPLPGNALP